MIEYTKSEPNPYVVLVHVAARWLLGTGTMYSS